MGPSLRWGDVVAMLVLLLLVASPATAQTFPKLTGRVVDQADLLRPEQEIDLSSKLEALEAQTGRQLVVATVKSLEGREIEPYATQLGRAWKIGDEERDDGVVLLVAPNERKVWIATGYGADDVLTDAMSGLIIRGSILPHFKKEPPDYGAGIAAGVAAISQQLQLPPEEARRRAEQAGAAEAKRGAGGFNPMPVIFMVFIFFFVISSIARKAGGRRYRGRGGRRGFDSGDAAIILWGLDALTRSGGRRGGWGGGFGGFGGGGGGGFGGFSGGGGSFGGGGAGGSW